jgi:hypothetical protein
MMNEVTCRLQREAERIASRHRVPEFYRRFKAPIALARRLYFTHSEVVTLRDHVAPLLQESLGHGLFHSSRVGIDAAAIICVEMEAAHIERPRIERLMVLGLMAGLLHDIRRGEENHAEAGAIEAKHVLQRFSLTDDEIRCVSRAIRNHEAFRVPKSSRKPAYQLLSDSLYDGDKFRWGRDTFTHTLWCMMSHQGLTPRELIERFPWGMTGIVRILDTFRSTTGKHFGPEIIENGVAIGREIYRYLLQNF